MSRISDDLYVANELKSGFDYENQCWVIDYIIQPCGHRPENDCRCFGLKYAGQDHRIITKKARDSK